MRYAIHVIPRTADYLTLRSPTNGAKANDARNMAISTLWTICSTHKPTIKTFLRSAYSNQLNLPSVKLSNEGARAFSCFGTEHLRDSSLSHDGFRRHLNDIFCLFVIIFHLKVSRSRFSTTQHMTTMVITCYKIARSIVSDVMAAV